MEFGILGSLEVLEDGRLIRVAGAKQRALLAILLLHANEVVSSDRLVEALWDGTAPDSAHKGLQVYVSHLRKTLGKERLETTPAGYLLHIAEGELDLERFQRLMDEGGPREALALWRGKPLADFTYHQFAQAEIARLEELRLACLELRIDEDLANGRHATLVGELEQLVREHPLRERLRAQHMLALYRSGRQAEALEVFAETRRLLSDELGLEPSGDLRGLQRRILGQDPTLEVAVEVPATQLEGVRGFVGRELELETMRELLDDALAGRGRLVLVSGEPGIGKSRLVEELATHARARRLPVLVGRCWEAGGAPAYWPWVQSLRAYMDECSPVALREQLGVGASSLAQLFPELRDRYPDLPAPPPSESEDARFWMFEATASFLRHASEAQPLVLILDDLHAADEPSLLLLRFLARDLGRSRVLLVGVYRDVDPSLRDSLVETLADLGREAVTRRLELTGLVESDVAAFISLTSGIEPEPETVAQIHDETDGNPLFVGELVRLLSAEGRLEGVDGGLRIPPGVRDVIGSRIRRLSDPCQEILVHGSVLGREFAVEVLGQLSGVGPAELLETLDEAMTERIVTDVPGSPGRLRYAHALIRDTLYDGLSSARRLALHRKAGESLEHVHAPDVEPHLAEIAFHFFVAAPVGTRVEAIEYARRAGERAASLVAYEEAARLYEMALALTVDDAERCELLLALGEAQARAGETPSSKASFLDAAALAEKLGLAEHLGRAALGYGSRMLWDVSRGDEHLIPLLERAIAGLGRQDSALRVRLLARLAGGPLRDARFDPERRRSLSAEALEIARRVDDPSAIAYALAGYIAARHSPLHTHRQVELASELIEVATAAGDVERAIEAHEHRFEAVLELGDADSAKADLDAMFELAGRIRQPSHDWFVTEIRGHLALLEGRLADAEALMNEARRLGERAEAWSSEVSFRLQLYMLRRLQGRLDEVVDLVRRSADEYPTYPICRCVLAQVAAELGLADAEAQFSALADDGFSALRLDETWLAAMSLLAEAAVALGHTEAAAEIHARLLPFDDRVAVSTPEVSTGAVARYLGILASTLERWDDAERHFLKALEVNERVNARPWLALTQVDYSRMLVARGGPADAERAQQLLGVAVESYRELGMEGALDRSREAGDRRR